MHRRVLKTMLLASFAALMALPAAGQIRADLGSLHIRIASEAPPRARYERRTRRPSRDAVWIRGYWDRQEDQWVWSSGRWDRPSRRGVHWVRARYVRVDRHWRYEPAHWSNQQIVEGEDYRRWRSEHDSNRDGRRHDHN